MAKKHRNRKGENSRSPGHQAKPDTKAKPESDAAADSTATDPTLTPEQNRASKFRVAAMRENVEAIVVAFILALLFRAFLAEAFVIPTGSMAPTLMGAHKDIFCDQCGQNFRVGASRERRYKEVNRAVVAGMCPNCRHVNSLDLAGDSDHETFNGDRILVNKFSYVLSDPERWDVIVFKFPGNPKQNYIKRLVGLPNETLSIFGGDVFAKPTGSEDTPEILRKPAETQLAMCQLIHDSDKQSDALIASEYPSRWQSWQIGADQPPDNSWQVERRDSGLTAYVDASQGEKWLRYFHRFPSAEQWDEALSGQLLSDVDPYSSRAITDFYAYGSYVEVPATFVYDSVPTSVPSRGGRLSRMLNSGYTPGVFKDRYQSGESINQFRRFQSEGRLDSRRSQSNLEGMHWVGDLLFTADIEFDSGCQSCTFEIIEAGVEYHCRFDLSTGEASLSIADGEKQLAFDPSDNQSSGGPSPNLNPKAVTSVQTGTKHQIRLSNLDDQLVLWVDDERIEFDSPTTFDSRVFRPADANRPYLGDDHPLDASPLGIAVSGGKATVERLQVHRDKYYIATNSPQALIDYDFKEMYRLTGRNAYASTFQDVLVDPKKWNDFEGWKTRRNTTYVLEEDQFFPMGDNSPESSDARCWAGRKARIPLPGNVNKDAWIYGDASYVPRDLLVGRAIAVFWPHSWSSPVPFTPNLKRMKLIR